MPKRKKHDLGAWTPCAHCNSTSYDPKNDALDCPECLGRGGSFANPRPIDTDATARARRIRDRLKASGLY